MLSFKQFLTESNNTPLYHALRITGKDNISSEDHYGIIIRKLKNISEKGILNITNQNKSIIQGNPAWSIETNSTTSGVSTTRDFQFAKIWSTQGIILELDSVKLRHNYKIVPVSYWRQRLSRRDEAEDFIITNKPIPPRYIKTIHIGKILMNIILNGVGSELYQTFQEAVYHIPLKVY